MSWEAAWAVVTKTFAYRNHTLLPEALEKWSVPLFQKVLPRHLQLIFEINKRLIETIEAAYPGDSEKKRSMSLIQNAGVQMLPMTNLPIVAIHSVNSVSPL